MHLMIAVVLGVHVYAIMRHRVSPVQNLRQQSESGKQRNALDRRNAGAEFRLSVTISDVQISRAHSSSRVVSR